MDKKIIRWRVDLERPLQPTEWRAAVYEALGCLPEATEAHTGRRSPLFSLSVSKDPHVAFVSACHPAAAETITGALARWTLGGEPVRAARVLDMCRPEDLVSAGPCGSVALRLKSPYLQSVPRRDGTAAIFDPNTALRGLMRSWQDNIGLDLPGDPFRPVWHIARIDARVAALDADGGARLLGLVGTVRVCAVGEEDDLAAAAALWLYAAFAGIGSHRTCGGGCVRPALLGAREEKEAVSLAGA